jgi:hypothetical protein
MRERAVDYAKRALALGFSLRPRLVEMDDW